MEKWTEAEVAQVRGRLRQRQQERAQDRDDREAIALVNRRGQVETRQEPENKAVQEAQTAGAEYTLLTVAGWAVWNAARCMSEADGLVILATVLIAFLVYGMRMI